MTGQDSAGHNSMERRLRLAGIFVIVGLLIEALALRWAEPTSFLAFAFIGIPIASLGVLIYLISLVTLRDR